MKILDDLLSLLHCDTTVKDIRQGVFHTGVVSRYCGLAATLPRDALRQDPPMVDEPGSLLDRHPRELAQLAHSPSILEAAIGMATVNSLLDVDEAACVEVNAADIIMKKGAGKKIAVVGHFPFIPRLYDSAAEVWVIEKNPRDGDMTESAAGDLIPRADVVAITGTSLTNHTLDHLLELCRHDAFVIILGDTAPLTPMFFDHGVDAISGTRVADPVLALQCVSQGATYRQIRGTKRLTMMK